MYLQQETGIQKIFIINILLVASESEKGSFPKL